MKKAKRAKEIEFPEGFFEKLDNSEKTARQEHNEKVESEASDGDEIVYDSFGYVCNLSRDESFPEEYRDLSYDDLVSRIDKEIGSALSYMLCYAPGRHGQKWDNKQIKRVKKMGKKFFQLHYHNLELSDERTEDQRLWARKQLWFLLEETENMC